VADYSLADVARIFDLSPARLRYWQRTELIPGSPGDANQPAFGFRDLVCIRTVMALLERGVPIRRIRRSVARIRERLPEIERPLDSLRVWVDGVEWSEVDTFYGAGPTDGVYELRHDDEGDAWIQFGDGMHGAIPPTGAGSVAAHYRYGSGLAGRVPRGSLTTLLRKPPGLGSATNPQAAEGGADPETLETSRLNAPRGVRTFGRIVSLQDFEDQVTLSGEVAKALATPVWDGRDVAIHLTVAGQAGATFTDEALRELGNNLATVRDPNHRLRLGNYRDIHVQLRAGVGVEPGYDPDEVVESARQAVIAALSFDAVSLGQSVAASDMYRVIQDVPGVRFVDIDWFMYKLGSLGTSFWSVLFELWRRRVTLNAAGLAPVQDRLRIFMAHPDPAHPGQVLPAELAAIDNPDEDVILEPRALVP